MNISKIMKSIFVVLVSFACFAHHAKGMDEAGDSLLTNEILDKVLASLDGLSNQEMDNLLAENTNLLEQGKVGDSPLGLNLVSNLIEDTATQDLQDDSEISTVYECKHSKNCKKMFESQELFLKHCITKHKKHMAKAELLVLAQSLKEQLNDKKHDINWFSIRYFCGKKNCKKSYKYARGLREHKVGTHKDGFTCPFQDCEEIFKSTGALRHHTLYKHKKLPPAKKKRKRKSKQKKSQCTQAVEDQSNVQADNQGVMTRKVVLTITTPSCEQDEGSSSVIGISDVNASPNTEGVDSQDQIIDQEDELVSYQVGPIVVKPVESITMPPSGQDGLKIHWF